MIFPETALNSLKKPEKPFIMRYFMRIIWFENNR